MEENCFNASHAGLERVNKEAKLPPPLDDT